MGFQASVSDCSNPRICRFLRLHFYLALPPHTFFYLFLDHSFRFFLPPDLSLSPYIFHPSTPLLYLFALASPLHITRAGIGLPPGRCPFLPASTACLRFPPLLGILRSSSLEPVFSFPRLFAPPFFPQPTQSGPCRSQYSPVQGSLD